MRRWFKIRRDRRHKSARAASPFRRARQLSVERCEDRHLLAGNALTLDVSPTTPTLTGGFLALDTSSLIHTSSNDFVVGDAVFARNLDVTTTSGLQFFGGIDYRLGADVLVEATQTPQVDPIVVATEQVLNRPTEFAEIAILEPPTLLTNDAASAYLQPSMQPLDLDLQRPLVEVETPLLVEPPVNIDTTDFHTPTTDGALAADTFDDNTVVGNAVQEPVDQPFPDAPGISGKTAQLEVIDDVIQLVGYEQQTTTRDTAEGGAIQVASAIASTQRAYETQLSATIVRKLNDDATLPTAPTPQRQPVLAELARAVAFETVSYQRSASHTAHEQSVEVETPSEPETATADSDLLSADDKTREDSSAESAVAQLDARHDPFVVEHNEPRRRPAERIDDESDSTVTSIFTRWTALISIVASYLLIERRPRSPENTVQTPPRRGRSDSPR